MNNNPLKQYFRRPAVYVKLPSGGKNYPAGSINMPETGELPVYPMTAIDEITTRTPDALFNGTVVVELIKSCVPDILDPWAVSSTDLDAIFLAIKAASGEQNLEIDSKCPKCSEISTYTIDLVAILNTLKSPDYDSMVEVNELKIKFGPLTYKEVNEAGVAQFEIQRLLVDIEKIADTKEKAEKTEQALKQITEVTMSIIAKTIQYVETPSLTVTEYDYILDYLRNCGSKVYALIRDHHTSLKTATELKPLDIKCGTCSHEYKQPFTLNPTDFFG